MGIRTPDLLHAMEARYQLRHSPSVSTDDAGPGPASTPVYRKSLHTL